MKKLLALLVIAGFLVGTIGCTGGTTTGPAAKDTSTKTPKDTHVTPKDTHVTPKDTKGGEAPKDTKGGEAPKSTEKKVESTEKKVESTEKKATEKKGDK